MPKETVHCVLDGRTVPGFDVVVAWNRDGVVQVTTVADDADRRLREWQEAGRETPALTAAGTSFRLFDGWHADLDRAGVNRLIRLLRNARDAAFGKDE